MQPVNTEKEVRVVTAGLIKLRIRNYVTDPNRMVKTNIETDTKINTVDTTTNNIEDEIKTVTGTEAKAQAIIDISNLEEWRELIDYPGYSVSNQGNIRGIKGKILNSTPDRDKYIQCKIKNLNGQYANRYVHFLVAITFIPNPDNKPIVNHINGIRYDNQVINLEWATHGENSGSMKVNKVQSDTRRQVVQYSIDGRIFMIWPSVKDAASSVGGYASNMSTACRTDSVYRGYRWKYKDIMETGDEEWKPVNYNGATVQASNLGNIRSVTGRIVRGGIYKGYVRVEIEGSRVFVHRLVCMAWKPIDNPEIYVVNHIDNDRTNNKIENLEWITQGENVNHYIANFHIGGVANKARAVRQLDLSGTVVITTFESGKEASMKTGIAASNISSVCRGNTRHRSAGGYLWQYLDAST